MAIARPRDNISLTGGSAAPTCSFATLPSAGSLVVVGFATWKTSTHTHNAPTDNQGNTYTQVGTMQVVNGTGDFLRESLWYAVNIGTPSGTFTVTCTCSANPTVDSAIVIAEYTGMATASPLDQQASGTPANSTAPTATLAATSNAADLIIGIVTYGLSTVTITQDATNLPTLVRENENNDSAQAIGVAERIVSSTGTYTGNWALSLSRNWICTVAAFKGAAAATTAPPPRPPAYALQPLLGR